MIYFTSPFHFSIFSSCKKKKNTSLSLLDQYILQESMYFENAIIGGLLGVDIVNNTYYFVFDDAINPRVLVAKMAISDDKINNVSFKKTIFLNDVSNAFFNENALDLESIFVDEKTK